jgi:Cu+-exporting ATPase
MRPAMSVMESTDTPPVPAHEAGVDVTVRPSTPPGAGRPTPLTLRLTDAETGRPVEDLVRTHQVWAHLIITRSDLATFAHLHAEPTGSAGELRVTATFPSPGAYRIRTEFRRQGQMADILDSTTIVVPGTPPGSEPPGADTTGEERRAVTTHGVTVRLDGAAHAGDTSDFRLRLTDSSTGRPVDDLQPYLGAAGHVVIIRSDDTAFAHQHAEAEDHRGRPVFALPGTSFGPDLGLHARFETAGTYRLWAQFELADGTVITAPFVVIAE